jgi:hypothetical protein
MKIDPSSVVLNFLLILLITVSKTTQNLSILRSFKNNLNIVKRTDHRTRPQVAKQKLS